MIADSPAGDPEVQHENHAAEPCPECLVVNVFLQEPGTISSQRTVRAVLRVALASSCANHTSVREARALARVRGPCWFKKRRSRDLQALSLVTMASSLSSAALGDTVTIATSDVDTGSTAQLNDTVKRKEPESPDASDVHAGAAPVPSPRESKKQKRLKQNDPARAERVGYGRQLGLCYKNSDIDGALRVWREVESKGMALERQGYNTLLSLFSTHNRPEVYDVFACMRTHGLHHSEPACATVIRRLSTEGKPEEAEKLLEEMIASGERPKLRSYSPIILSYSRKGNGDAAFGLYEQLGAHDIEGTEAEFAALLRVTTTLQDPVRFFRAVDEMKELVLELSSETLQIFADWFGGQEARGGPSVEVQRGVEVSHDDAKCKACGATLQSVELTEERAAQLLTNVQELVRAQENRKGEFEWFKSKLEGLDFDVVVDGANVGYFEMNYAGAPVHVNYDQIAWMIDHLVAQGKKPLLVLHARHVVDTRVPPAYMGLVKQWRKDNILVQVPFRNNDDWYWLYATVWKGGRTLVVTNDEMRDHHFQMLSQRAFLRWKERHRAYFALGHYRRGRRTVELMPPAIFSRCIQQTEGGWHLPQADTGSWMCIKGGDGPPL